MICTTVLTLSDDAQAKILNGKIIPGDRVFYPVKSHIRASVPKSEKNNLDGKRVCIINGDGDPDKLVGGDVLVAGSAVFGVQDPIQTIKDFYTV